MRKLPIHPAWKKGYFFGLIFGWDFLHKPPKRLFDITQLVWVLSQMFESDTRYVSMILATTKKAQTTEQPPTQSCQSGGPCGASFFNGHLHWSLETGSTPLSFRMSMTATGMAMAIATATAMATATTTPGPRGRQRWGASLGRRRGTRAPQTTHGTCRWGGGARQVRRQWQQGQRLMFS